MPKDEDFTAFILLKFGLMQLNFY